MNQSSELKDFILQQVVPICGLVTGTFMTFAPYRAVLKASRDGTLGDLNGSPWIFMLGNCCGWLAYSFMTMNVYVFLGNAPGFILAIWLNIQAIKLQYENHRSAELQTAIIGALEDIHGTNTSKNNPELVNKEIVTTAVEEALVIDEAMDILDPTVTAPIIEESESEELNSGNSTKYNSIQSTLTTEQDERQENGVQRRNSILPPAIQEAAEHFVDYAGLIWEIAAQRSQAPASHELMVVGISTFWLALITFVVFSQDFLEKSTRTLYVGVCVNVNLIFFYGAPLSKIATVLETRSSKLIHVPTMIFSLMNGILWFIYGFAVADPFIAVPNGFGAILGIVQAILCTLFPRHHRRSGDEIDGIWTKSAASTAEYSSTTGSISLPEESTPLI